MGKLRKLQEKYLKGEITKAEYEAQVKQLLTDEIIDQEQLDEALEYDPEHEKPQYSQADVDAMITTKAIRMVRKALKDAGVEIEADNKNLLTKVAETIKNGSANKEDGDGKNSKATDEELVTLKKQAQRAATLSERIKDLVVENAVLKEAGKYNPVNPVQVVRALRLDYMAGIDYDEETGEVDIKSVSRALKKVHETEPNLFKATDTEDNENNDFKGKGPGGGAGGGSKDHDAKKSQALEMLGIKKDTK